MHANFGINMDINILCIYMFSCSLYAELIGFVILWSPVPDKWLMYNDDGGDDEDDDIDYDNDSNDDDDDGSPIWRPCGGKRAQLCYKQGHAKVGGMGVSHPQLSAEAFGNFMPCW